jgi:hypothetical protein
MFPLAVFGVHGEVVRVVFDEIAQLYGSKIHSAQTFFVKSFFVDHRELLWWYGTILKVVRGA